MSTDGSFNAPSGRPISAVNVGGVEYLIEYGARLTGSARPEDTFCAFELDANGCPWPVTDGFGGFLTGQTAEDVCTLLELRAVLADSELTVEEFDRALAKIHHPSTPAAVSEYKPPANRPGCLPVSACALRVNDFIWSHTSEWFMAVGVILSEDGKVKVYGRHSNLIGTYDKHDRVEIAMVADEARKWNVNHASNRPGAA